MNKKTIFLSLIGIIFLFIIFFQEEQTAETQIYKRSIMGTTYSITVHSEANSQDIFFKASTILDKVNQEMSTYIGDSLISKVNRTEIGEWIKVSEDFLNVLIYASDLCAKSDGMYDVSIGKLVNLWGFGPDSVNKPPSDKQIEYLSSQVGCDSIQIDTRSSSVRRNKDIALDFSSIAKGFAIDKVFKFLNNQEQLEGFFIELGGEIRSTKYKSNQQPWKAGVINPMQPQKIIYSFLSSDYESFAMATSGDYMNIRVHDGEERSHTINPKSGLPSNYSKKSVSVISDSGMKADALATTLNIMPLKQALEYANTNKIMAMFVMENNNGYKLIFSDQLETVKI